jgi:hypothetical protein
MDYNSFLNDAERAALNKINKVIVWGFPIHTHTHSYIHAMWIKVFKEGFGKDAHWFHDKEFPSDFDYNHCLFITEGYADANIPIVDTSVYFVHNAINPERYLNKNARLIEIRFNVMEIHDINNDFKLDDGTHEGIIQLSNETKYEKLSSNKDIHLKNRGETIKPMNYECIYLYWATDLLPHEFNYDDMYNRKDGCVYYVGSPVNSINYLHFRHICQANNIGWVTFNPWNNPISFEDNQLAMKHSLLCPDFRPVGTESDVQEFGEKNGKNHLAIGYLPCRVLKAISYGNIGITDSYLVKQILGEHVLYDPDMNKLFQMAINERQNYARIQAAMKFIQENHTYVNRARDLIRAIIQ